ncbi:hypothetical protein DMA15_03710 [Streptomyces sp. WAC 01529]|uniref:hypothetical protein n=1 Tax=Streptomyces sp. WAC 01529 TaxID=2203205 RepID=UPI000F707FBE|nr:hypothetical protein [Streptomyces sp. WAC 01529]AZM51800.1 hypothetical protein DMA15_03710 [Streptomyces sp. WAC 01529]
MTSPFIRPDAPAQPPGGVRRFWATYGSDCERCGTNIDYGDEAGYIDDDDAASCGDCCDEAEDNGL